MSIILKIAIGIYKSVQLSYMDAVGNKVTIIGGSVIGDYVELKRSGRNQYKAMSPFSNERTPLVLWLALKNRYGMILAVARWKYF